LGDGQRGISYLLALLLSASLFLALPDQQLGTPLFNLGHWKRGTNYLLALLCLDLPDQQLGTPATRFAKL